MYDGCFSIDGLSGKIGFYCFILLIVDWLFMFIMKGYMCVMEGAVFYIIQLSGRYIYI